MKRLSAIFIMLATLARGAGFDDLFNAWAAVKTTEQYDAALKAIASASAGGDTNASLFAVLLQSRKIRVPFHGLESSDARVRALAFLSKNIRSVETKNGIMYPIKVLDFDWTGARVALSNTVATISWFHDHCEPIEGQSAVLVCLVADETRRNHLAEKKAAEKAAKDAEQKRRDEISTAAQDARNAQQRQQDEWALRRTVRDIYLDAVRNHEVRIGMNKAEAEMAWGKPQRKTTTEFTFEVSEVWYYNSRSIQFSDGVVHIISKE